jgi:predicted cupin superfamily sugar epimerase
VADAPVRLPALRGRAVELICALGLDPHPEGGYFREVFRSRHQVSPFDGRGTRAALTTIDFLLPAGSVSRWHQVDSDEVWHFYEGEPLELWILSPNLEDLGRHLLGPLDVGTCRREIVPAGWWQAARSTGAFSLVGCTVGPGFDFMDFRLAAATPGLVAELCRRHPTVEGLL